MSHAWAVEKRTSILGELEALDALVGVPDENHITFGLLTPPAANEQVEDEMQVDVGKQQR